jgi:hypothetical protein
LERNGHQQAWYLARHLKSLSGNLAALGYGEAALLVGAAAISVGDQIVQRTSVRGVQQPSAPEKPILRHGGAQRG